MILAYPIGIPMTFAYLLLERRDKINPPEETEAESTPDVYPSTSAGTSRSINTGDEVAGRAAAGFVSSGGETNRTASEQGIFTADPSCDMDVHRQEVRSGGSAGLGPCPGRGGGGWNGRRGSEAYL